MERIVLLISYFSLDWFRVVPPSTVSRLELSPDVMLPSIGTMCHLSSLLHSKIWIYPLITFVSKSNALDGKGVSYLS